MAWSFRASDSAFNEESSNPVVVNKPTGTVDEDLLIAFGNKDFSADFGTPPTGFASIQNIADADQRHVMWWKLAGGSEPSTYSWAKPNGDGIVCLIAWDGCDTADPADVSSQNQAGASTSHVASGVTPTNDDALLVGGYGTDVQSAGAITWTTPTGMTEREDRSTASDIWSSGSIHDEVLTGGGATGDRTATASSSQQYGAILAAFNIGSVIIREQEAYRWRDDDGSESAATWLAAQDVNITRAKTTTTRVRLLLNMTDDPPSEQYKIQERKVGDADSEWRDIV